MISITCPACKKVHKADESLLGKRVKCKDCGVMFEVTWNVSQPIQQPNAGKVEQMMAATRPLSTGITPLPPTDRASDFSNVSKDGPAATRVTANAVREYKIEDMFSGNEKEHVFSLLPGEDRIDELTIYHKHLFIVKSGITRVTLTTHRVLYTTTRVFSPIYWLLVVLFPPLLLYYAVRIMRNRNVSLPLGSIDSVEKQYRPNWLIFIVAIIVGYIVASLCGKAVESVFNESHQYASSIETIITSIIVAMLSPAVLVLLLATRCVGFQVRTKNNHFPIVYSPEDRGASEEKLDAFFKRVHAQMDHDRMFSKAT
jgi:hypothetical protein